MSDRAIPRSFAMMEGFGVHNFRFVDAKGKSCFVKFHCKPVLGEHSLVWDEAVKLAGKDTDFHRGDLWEAIDKGQYPEFELGVQIVPELVFMLFSYTDTQLSHLGGPNFPEIPINRPMVITAGAGALFGVVA